MKMKKCNQKLYTIEKGKPFYFVVIKRCTLIEKTIREGRLIPYNIFRA